MNWILIVFVSQVGNPQLIMTQPPKFVEGMEVCLTRPLKSTVTGTTLPWAPVSRHSTNQITETLHK